MRLRSVFEATWSTLSRRRPTVASLFRRADQQRMDGLYEEAARLLAEGLELAPESSVGHLLMAYLHADLRRADLARSEFERVLGLDPYHPRALLGLARIAIEEGDARTSLERLEKALAYYPDFPEATALRDAVENWPGSIRDTTAAPAPDVGGANVASRDLVLVQTDGSPTFALGDAERGRQLARHASSIWRMASAVLGRAGLGPLQHALIAAPSGTTVLLGEPNRIFSVTLDGPVNIGRGLAEAARLRTAFEVKG